MFGMLFNTVEGLTQAVIGTVKLAAAPVTNLINLEEDHFGDATKTISKGLKKVGKSND